MNPTELTHRLKAALRKQGFEKVGLAPALPDPEAENRLHQWFRAGFEGTMHWMKKRSVERGNVLNYFPEAKSVIVVALNYFTGRVKDRMATADTGLKISNYAWGQDYHELMISRIKAVQTQYREWTNGGESRVCVDMSPVMEKDWARKAGLGWQGKHTNIITRDLGSWIFLGEFIIDRELDYDAPFTADYCGSCTACIDACPTQALTDYVLDARKCISYLTIEHRGPFPEGNLYELNGWIYGCDICQEVCPWNRKLEKTTTWEEFQPLPEIQTWTCREWENMDETKFREIFRHSPIKRTRFEGMKRNLVHTMSPEKGNRNEIRK
ncbi:MAG: tRNA epoxyqueuosine(34) reductase QueG [FCB group bacterium]|nr:tRNA epoxyqueuosine(34) reductase QueG [FCB group bacterium]